MKKIFTLIVLAASITTGFAQWQQYPQQRGGPRERPNYPRQDNNYNQSGSLVVSSALQRPFSVTVDNQQYQSNGNNSAGNVVNIGQLNPGNHNIIVYQWRTNLWGKQTQSVVYNSSLYVKPGFETTIFINGAGQVNISERQVYNYEDQGYGNNGNGVGHGYGRKKNKHKKNHCDNDDDDRNRRFDRNKYDRRHNDD